MSFGERQDGLVAFWTDGNPIKPVREGDLTINPEEIGRPVGSCFDTKTRSLPAWRASCGLESRENTSIQYRRDGLKRVPAINSLRTGKTMTCEPPGVCHCSQWAVAINPAHVRHNGKQRWGASIVHDWSPFLEWVKLTRFNSSHWLDPRGLTHLDPHLDEGPSTLDTSGVFLFAHSSGRTCLPALCLSHSTGCSGGEKAFLRAAQGMRSCVSVPSRPTKMATSRFPFGFSCLLDSRILPLARHAVYLERQSACVSSLTFCSSFPPGTLFDSFGRPPDFEQSISLYILGIFWYLFLFSFILLAFGWHIREKNE